MAVIWSPCRVSTISPAACATGACSSLRQTTNAGWVLAQVGTSRNRRGPREAALWRNKGAIARALVLQRHRRHREPRVVCQQRDQAIDIVGFEGAGEARTRARSWAECGAGGTSYNDGASPTVTRWPC